MSAECSRVTDCRGSRSASYSGSCVSKFQAVTLRLAVICGKKINGTDMGQRTHISFSAGLIVMDLQGGYLEMMAPLPAAENIRKVLTWEYGHEPMLQWSVSFFEVVKNESMAGEKKRKLT